MGIFTDRVGGDPPCLGVFRRSHDGNNQPEKIRNQQRVFGTFAGKVRICQEEG